MGIESMRKKRWHTRREFGVFLMIWMGRSFATPFLGLRGGLGHDDVDGDGEDMVIPDEPEETRADRDHIVAVSEKEARLITPWRSNAPWCLSSRELS